MRRMGYTKRRANSKSKVLPSDFVKIKEDYLLNIKSVVEIEEIPDCLLINSDQTSMKIVPSCSWTMEKRGTKRVEIAALDDKRQITAVFACSLSGTFLPVQLLYQGTTEKCLPKNIEFPSNWHITCSSNHWSNQDTMVDYVAKIIVPYVEAMRRQHNLDEKHPALVLFDTFRGQCVPSVLKLLEENNIHYLFVPPNTTDKLQPLDLSVNKSAKDFMKSKFQEWYSSVIEKQLQDDIEEEVDMRLSVMKPLSAKWTIELYDYFLSRPDIIINGFRAAGIVDILSNN